jgi:hypothetical protein
MAYRIELSHFSSLDALDQENLGDYDPYYEHARFYKIRPFKKVRRNINGTFLSKIED